MPFHNALVQIISTCPKIGSLCIKMNTLQAPHPSVTKIHTMVKHWYYKVELKFTHFLRISVILLGRLQAISVLCMTNVQVANKIKIPFCQYFLWTWRYL